MIMIFKNINTVFPQMESSSIDRQKNKNDFSYENNLTTN